MEWYHMVLNRVKPIGQARLCGIEPASLLWWPCALEDKNNVEGHRDHNIDSSIWLGSPNVGLNQLVEGELEWYYSPTRGQHTYSLGLNQLVSTSWTHSWVLVEHIHHSSWVIWTSITIQFEWMSSNITQFEWMMIVLIGSNQVDQPDLSTNTIQLRQPKGMLCVT
jgi:hypothetical protein